MIKISKVRTEHLAVYNEFFPVPYKKALRPKIIKYILNAVWIGIVYIMSGIICFKLHTSCIHFHVVF